jgi:uncharacterized repeat protein (TIGR03803 family)
MWGILIGALTPYGAQAWTESVLYTFKGGNDGQWPVSTLISDGQGNLYGTTYGGGAGCTTNQGCGTVFRLSPDGTKTVLHAFSGANVVPSDGSHPSGPLAMDAANNLYGTTIAGGAGCFCGTVFRITPAGAYTILHSFRRADGVSPLSGVTIDGAGNLYSVASLMGLNNGCCGTVFKITPAGEFTLVYEFKGGDGESPQSPLIIDSMGDLYGTTQYGGVYCASRLGPGCGTVFKIAANGTESVLYAFRGGRDGNVPMGTLVMATDGSLIGSTLAGGGTACGDTDGCGTIFKVSSDGNETLLSTLNRSNGPATPFGGVIARSTGALFGTSRSGGAAGCGTVFRLWPGQVAKTIYSFTCGPDGRDPQGGLLLGKHGTLYGTTFGGGEGLGVVFALTP